MNLFEKYFIRNLLQEDNTTASGGAWGDGASVGQPTPYSSISTLLEMPGMYLAQ